MENVNELKDDIEIKWKFKDMVTDSNGNRVYKYICPKCRCRGFFTYKDIKLENKDLLQMNKICSYCGNRNIIFPKDNITLSNKEYNFIITFKNQNPINVKGYSSELKDDFIIIRNYNKDIVFMISKDLVDMVKREELIETGEEN